MPECCSRVCADTASTSKSTRDTASTSKSTRTSPTFRSACSKATEVSVLPGLQEPRRASCARELLGFRTALERALSCALPMLEACDADLADALVMVRCKGRQVISRATGVILGFSHTPTVCASLRDAAADTCDLSDLPDVVDLLASARGWMGDLQKDVKACVDDYIDFEEHVHYLVQCVDVVADDAAFNSANEGPGDGRRERQAALEGALVELQQAMELFAKPCGCFGSSALAEGGLMAAIAWVHELECQLTSGSCLDELPAYCDNFCGRLEKLHAVF